MADTKRPMTAGAGEDPSYSAMPQGRASGGDAPANIDDGRARDHPSRQRDGAAPLMHDYLAGYQPAVHRSSRGQWEHPFEQTHAQSFWTSVRRHPVNAVGDELRRFRHHSVSARLFGWSLVLGLLVGLVVSAFRWAVGALIPQVRRLYAFTRAGNWWMIAVIIAASLILSVLIALIVRHEPAVSGSGIPMVEARLRSSRPIFFHWWRVLWSKIIGGLLAFAPGLFLGREGPSVQIGAAVGMGMGNVSHTTRSNRKELVAAGAAAGLAAAFSAPIAGMIFVVEEIFGRFTLQTAFCSLASALVSSAVAKEIFGLGPVFVFPTPVRLPISDYWQLLLVAFAVGLIAKLYEWTLKLGIGLYAVLRVPQGLRGFVPMMLMILCGLLLPEVLGGGNDFVSFLASHSVRLSFWMILLYFVVRLIGSQLSYGSGVPGGIFLPILVLGALSGMGMEKILVAMGAHADTPGYAALMAIAAMAGLFGAVTKAPLTAILLVMEMTSYAQLQPLGVVTLLAYMVYDLLGGEPIYDELGRLNYAIAARYWRRGRVAHTDAPLAQARLAGTAKNATAGKAGAGRTASASSAAQSGAQEA